ETTEAYYNRVVHTYSVWTKRKPDRSCPCQRCVNMSLQEGHPDASCFCDLCVSAFLRDKQAEGASPYYVKSLRNGLRTLLRSSGRDGKIRTVNLPRLSISVWSEDDVKKLVAAVPRAIFPLDTSMRALYRRHFWSTLIPAAWYSGLSQGDLFRL